MKKSMRFCILLAMLFLIGIPAGAGPAPAAGEIPVVLLPIEHSPLITFRIQFAVGSMNDPAGKKGITALTAALVTDGGTRKKTYDEIVDLFYPMATRITSRVDKEVTTIVGTVHVDNLERFYALMKEMLLEPGFRKADFERIKSNQINYLAKQLRSNDDEELGKEALNAFLYPGHPYGQPVAGLIDDLRAITLDDCRGYYARMFTRDAVVLGMAGGYSPELVGTAVRDLGMLPAGAVPAVDVSRTEPIHGIEVLAVEKNCRSTAISMGFPIAVTRSDADFYPLMIANSYFGEHRTFNGVLMIQMRELRGLNYGDYSYIENFIQEGGSTFPLTNIPRRQQHFSIWIRPVLHENRHFAVREAVRELQKLLQNGISKEDFELTRKFLVNYSRLWAQDQSRRLGYLMDSRFYGTGDFIATLPAVLDKVTLDQVNAAAKKYLNFENIRIAIVTQGAGQLLQELIDNTPSPIHYEAKEMPADVLAEDAEIQVYPLRINTEKSRVVDADDLFVR
jgi:zinc protease